jgi:hypothetical protein
MPGLTSKIFRTYYASKAVLEKLCEFETHPEDSEYKKLLTAKLANLEAAKALNHKRMLPKNWSERVAARALLVHVIVVSEMIFDPHDKFRNQSI